MIQKLIKIKNSKNWQIALFNEKIEVTRQEICRVTSILKMSVDEYLVKKSE